MRHQAAAGAVLAAAMFGASTDAEAQSDRHSTTYPPYQMLHDIALETKRPREPYSSPADVTRHINSQLDAIRTLYSMILDGHPAPPGQLEPETFRKQLAELTQRASDVSRKPAPSRANDIDEAHMFSEQLARLVVHLGVYATYPQVSRELEEQAKSLSNPNDVRKKLELAKAAYEAGLPEEVTTWLVAAERSCHSTRSTFPLATAALGLAAAGYIGYTAYRIVRAPRENY